MSEGEINPARYREINVPVADYATASKAPGEFYEEVKALRLKHRIPGVHITMSMGYVTAEGQETNVMTCAHIGDSMKTLHMAAYAYGSARQSFDEVIDTIATRHKRSKRN